MNPKNTVNSGLLNAGLVTDTRKDAVSNFSSWNEWWGVWTKLKDSRTMEELQRRQNFFRCMSFDCSYSTMDRKEFSHHLRNVHPAAHHICSYCLVGGFTAESLCSHSEKHSSLIFQCSNCVYRASTPVHVILHSKDMHIDSKTIQVWKCEWTPTPSKPVKLTVDNILPFYCSVCNFNSKYVDQFCLHQSVHPSTTCFFCNSSMASFNSLIVHLRSHGIYDFHCYFCSFGAEGPDSVLRHICLIHPEKEIQVCSRMEVQVCKNEICGTVVRTSDSCQLTDDHARSCRITKNQPNFQFLCVFCDYVSPLFDVMFNHLKTSHETDELETSELDSEKEKWILRYLEAQKLSAQPSVSCLIPLKLQPIKKIKPSQCPMCLRRCGSRVELFIHIVSHLQYKPYQCSYCDWYFACFIQVQKHIEMNHSRQPVSYKTLVIPFVNKWIHCLVYGKNPTYWPLEIPCKECCFRTTTKRALEVHYRKNHKTADLPLEITDAVTRGPKDLKTRKLSDKIPKTTAKQVVAEPKPVDSVSRPPEPNVESSKGSEPSDIIGPLHGTRETLELEQSTALSVPCSTTSGNISEEKSLSACPTNPINSENSNNIQSDSATQKSEVDYSEDSLSSDEAHITSDSSTEWLPSSEVESDVITLKCSVCKYNTTHLNEFQNHYKSEHSSKCSRRKRRCLSSDNTSETRSEISHSPVSAPHRKCPYCRLGPFSIKMLNLHVSINHMLGNRESVVSSSTHATDSLENTKIQVNAKSKHTEAVAGRSKHRSESSSSSEDEQMQGTRDYSSDSSFGRSESETYLSKETEKPTYSSRYGMKPEPIDFKSVFISLKNPCGTRNLRLSLEYYKNIWFTKTPKVILKDCIFGSI